MKRTDIEALLAVAGQLHGWMTEASWPLWSQGGRHPSSRFYEVLEFDGSPRKRTKSRVRTQARQVYSFGLANELGWKEELTADIVRKSLPVLLSSGLRSDGIAGRTIDIESGELLDGTADLYDTAFCLLAIAQGRSIVGADTADELVDTLLSNIDAKLKYEDGQGYRETLPAGEARLQNPHMHFFESLLNLFDKTGREDVWHRAEDLYQYISHTFFDRSAAVVREGVEDNGNVVQSGYDPGHSMEWVWLMGYRTRLGDDDLPDFAYDLYEHACVAYQKHGRTFLYLTDDNEPLDASARLWSQTETLKAHLCISELGDPSAAENAVKAATRCAEDMLGFWLQSDAKGGWLDHFDPDGKLVCDAMTASTGYHLYLAIAELMRVATSLNRSFQGR